MLGLVLSLLVSVSPAPASASVTCADGPASCDAAAVWLAGGPDLAPADADAGEAPRYATPAVIDCRAPVVPAVLLTLVGECDGTPRDASYRTSRYPESEESRGTLAPAKQSRDRRAGVAACNGLPSDGGADLPLTAPQPLALFALPDLVPDAAAAPPPAHAFTLPSRTTDPPERPPRA